MDVTTRLLTFIFDWNIFGKLSGQITDESGSTNSSVSKKSSDFVKQFDGLAQKLLQESKKKVKKHLMRSWIFRQIIKILQLKNTSPMPLQSLFLIRAKLK